MEGSEAGQGKGGQVEEVVEKSSRGRGESQEEKGESEEVGTAPPTCSGEEDGKDDGNRADGKDAINPGVI